jgi:outer membrane protein OmpA-like peptidoglycan-associated protein
MKLRLALAAATCLALPLAAHAQPVTGPYVSAEGGFSIFNPVNYRFTDFSDDFGTNGKYLTKPSYAGAVSVGYGFGDGFRVELSGDYNRNTFHKNDFSISDFGSSYNFQYRTHGGENIYGPMLNVLYDVNAGLPVYPYVGGGVGYQWDQLSAPLKDDFTTDKISGDKGSFAFDVIAGLSYPIPMVPGLSVTAEYRFMMLTESRKYNSSYTETEQSAVHSDIASETFSDGPVKLGQQSIHSFMVGLRYQIFNPPPVAPAPAPAPVAAAPAPAPAKTYLVFFDWDKSTLTPRATQIIAEAASDSKSTAVTTISVSGYTDTSGTPVYNQGLSERRASAVAAQLVTDGVPASEIETHAYGETHLLVPTGPGVREPQNRRVEIVLD